MFGDSRVRCTMLYLANQVLIQREIRQRSSIILLQDPQLRYESMSLLGGLRRLV